MNDKNKISLIDGRVCSFSKERVKNSQLNSDNFIGVDNLLPNKLGKTRSQYVPNKGSSIKFNPNDILIGNIRPYLKKIWYSNISGGASSDVIVLKVNKNFDPKFVFYNLFQDSFFDFLNKTSKGSRMPRGDKQKILHFKILNLDLTKQKKIASVLSALDEKIELNNKINEELEKMAKLLYDYWFVQFDFPDENGRPYKSSGGKMVWNEELKREIPEGWELENLFDNSLTKIIKPGINFFEGEKTYIATADLNENQINFFAKKITFVKRETRANMEPKYNSVWFAKMMKTKKAIYFGDYSDFFINQFILSTGFLGLECKKNYYLEYIWNFINNYDFENIKDKLANGAVQLAINNNSLKFIPLLKPREEILINFHKKTYSIYKKIYLNQIENFILIQLRDWLLPMLMNGQVVVE